MLALALFLCGLFCCRCWPAGGDVTEVTEVTEVTDHPSRALEESLLRGAGRGQLPPALSLRLRQQGQQGPEAAEAAAQRAQRANAKEAQRARTWLLTQEGVPCNLPFWYEGQKYEGCHPEGWCCLDERCARTGTCSDLSQTSLPLLLPRDVPETGCQLETLDRRPFERLPGARPEDDKNLVFFILREGEEVEDEDLGSLLTVLSSIDMSMVLMSYATPAAEAEKAVRALEQSILRMLTNSSAEEVASVLQKLYLVPEPAQALSYYSCWLPAVIQARSKDKEVLVLQADTGDTGGKAELATTVAPGTRGGWASSLKPDLMGPELPVRWAGFLCGQDPKPEWPPAASDLSGFVALVARGDCSFYQKVQRAQAQGAIAVIIFSQDETPGMMGCAAPDPCDETLSISAVMTGLHVGQLLLESMFPANVSGADSEGQVPQVLARFTTQRQGPSMVGLLGHGGGLWYDSFPGFGRAAAELRGMEFRRQLLSHRQEVAQLTLGGDSLRVPVFEEEFMPGSITQKWTAEHAALVRQGSYDELEIELRLDCPDHLDENCPPWDHELNLFVCTEGRSERPVDCDGSDDTIARWITPYGREGHWITKAPAAIPLLTSPEALKSSASLRLATWQKYTVSLVFWFRRRAGAGRAGSALAPLERLPLWSGGAFNPSYNPAHDPISFHMPARAHRVVLSTLITGHGWGVDEANCAEFCNHVHHFAVNGVASPLLVKDHPEASTSDGCQRQVAQGVVPNQYGTWPFGRAGWCPGKDVDWWEVDITEWVVADALNNITYRALFNGTDYEPVPSEDSNDLGFPAEIHLVSALVFYGDSPETTSAQQLASQESQAPERIVLP